MNITIQYTGILTKVGTRSSRKRHLLHLFKQLIQAYPIYGLKIDDELGKVHLNAQMIEAKIDGRKLSRFTSTIKGKPFRVYKIEDKNVTLASS